MSRNVSAGRVPVFTLGERIRKAREDAGMSQGELALAIGHDRKTVGNWENERGKNPPNYGELMLLASVTDISLEWLAGDLYRPTTGAGNVANRPGSSDVNHRYMSSDREYQYARNVTADQTYAQAA